MPNNISVVQCKLIGISCLEGKERQRVMQEWDERFQEHEAFWVDAKAGQNTMSLAQTIAGMIRSQGITALSGQSIVMAVFLDLTREPDEALLGEILKVPKVLSKALGCMVPLTLEFGFLAELAFGDAEALKANVRKVVDMNCQNTSQRKQLCLVGISPLWQKDEDISWKSVMICLDLLRRDSSPAAMIPVDGVNACNNVGFLRYGEYDEEKLQHLAAEMERIERARSANGAMEFRNALNMALGRIESDVEKLYPVDGGCQPIHPKMYPEGFIERVAAQHGNNPFATARNHTLHALSITSRQLKDTIFAAYRDQIQDAPAYLIQYMKKANIGIELESDRKQMEDILSPEPIGMAEPMMPSLAYMETGYTIEIDNYLKGVRRYAGAKARHDFAKALLEAYRQVPDSQYSQRRSVLQQDYTNVQNKIGRLMTKQQLLDIVASGGVLPGSAFRPTRAAGRNAYWALCRDVQIGAQMDAALASTMAIGYFIDATYGGLKMLDNAPMKAVQLLQFECNDDCLQDLIG